MKVLRGLYDLLAACLISVLMKGMSKGGQALFLRAMLDTTASHDQEQARRDAVAAYQASFARRSTDD